MLCKVHLCREKYINAVQNTYALCNFKKHGAGSKNIVLLEKIVLLEMSEFSQKKYLIPGIYLSLIFVCSLILFFDPKSTVGAVLTLALFILTVPGSLLAGFFILGVFLFGDESANAVIFFVLGYINACLLYKSLAKKG